MKIANKIELFIAFMVATVLFALHPIRQCSANDMPLEGFPASGIVVRDEKNIEIEKEDLYISRTKIEVSYIFKNNSDKDIITEVAFPVPLHEYDPTGIIKYPLHGDFKVETNDKTLKYQEISKAIINKKDVTSVLKRLDISFKDFEYKNRNGKVFGWYFNKLSKTRQQTLIKAGVVKQDDQEMSDEPWYVPAWSVETTYHWTQVFPAHKSTLIKHTYTPNASHSFGIDDYDWFARRHNKNNSQKVPWADLLCLDKDTAKWAKNNDNWFEVYIVDYILTTANHWKKPIKEFHLIIEASPALNERVSTCFEKSRLRKVNDKRYEMTIKDFIPSKDISVFFLNSTY